MAARQVGIQAGEPLGAHNDPVHHHRAQPRRSVDLDLQPRQEPLTERYYFYSCVRRYFLG